MAITRDAEFPGLEAAWALTERYLLGIRDLARARGAPFVLVVYPHSHQVSARESPRGRRHLGVGPGLYASERPFTRLQALGRRAGFPVIDLLAAFRSRTGGAPLFRPDDMHHTPAGAAVFADGIAAGLTAPGMPAACPKGRISRPAPGFPGRAERRGSLGGHLGAPHVANRGR
jgi:hypothetical protein